MSIIILVASVFFFCASICGGKCRAFFDGEEEGLEVEEV